MSKSWLTIDQMEKLPTKRLLAYLKSWREVPEHKDYHESIYSFGKSQLCKEDQKWKEQYEKIKSVLANREHLKKEHKNGR